MPHSQGLSSNLYPSRINPILHIDTYFFKIHIVPPLPIYAYSNDQSGKINEWNICILVDRWRIPYLLNFPDIINLFYYDETLRMN